MSSLKRHAILDWAIVLVGSLACLELLGYFQLDWSQPARLDADHLFVLTAAKSYINGHGFRLDGQLGYPDVRDGLLFPSFDWSYRAFLWLAARCTTNPFLVAHSLYVAGIAAMFGLTYWTLMRLGTRAWLAAIGALSYVLTPFLANRIFAHDLLILSFSVPVGLGLALMIGTSRPDVTLKAFMRDPFTIATILIVGTSGLYYAFFGLMFLAFVGVAASAAQRRWFPLLAAVSVGAPLFVILLLGAFGPDLLTALGPEVSAPVRQPYEQIMYGLDLPSMAAPFARLSHKIAQGVAQTAAAFPAGPVVQEGAGEWPALPLMLALVSAPLLAAICHGAERVGEATAHQVRLIGWCALCVVFAILFGARGGLGYLFNLIVSPEIRADGRLMPYLNFAAVAILCASAELLARLEKWRWAGYAGQALIAVMLLVSIKPALGAARKVERGYMTGPLESRLQASTPLMIEAKNRGGLLTVLELPVASWPESPFIQILDTYEHQLPYIYDTPGNPTRWSYGSNDHQPWFGVVNLASRDPQTLVTHARRLGFDGVLVQKRGFAPAGLAALQTALSAQLVPECKLFEDDVEALYSLVRAPSGRPCKSPL